jgi:CPA2 family monovalent cation:H+ antiporter-2
MSTPEDLIVLILPLFIVGVIIIFLSLRLKLPPIVGFLLVGVLLGPSGVKPLLTDPHQVEGLSELGVILLLFTIGLEFSFQEFVRLKRVILVGGGLQMGLTIAAVWLITFFASPFSWQTCLIIGCLAALSSTAIVLKIFQDKGEMDSTHGRGALGVLIFQDIAVVPLIILIPLLAGKRGGEPIYMFFVKIWGIVLFVLVANWLVPKLMKKVAETKSNELFMFTVILICIGTAYVTSMAGLSLALGAFLAGLIIASSPYATLAISSIMPMRDIFTSFFFVTIGLRMELLFFRQHLPETILLTLAVMILNAAIAAGAMRLTNLSPRVSILVALSLCQIGEFSFVLASKAAADNLIDENVMKMFLNVAVLSMAITPLAMALGKKISPYFAESGSPFVSDEKNGERLENHVMVVGFGVAGQAVARACHELGKRYNVIDMNPASVRKFRNLGEPLNFGDAASEHVLDHMGAKKALVLVITIPDPEATRRIIAAAKKLNPELKILARTRFLANIKILKQLGADEVVAEEFEAALSVFNSMLLFFGVEPEYRKSQIAIARKSGPQNFWSAPLLSPDALKELGKGENHIDHVPDACDLAKDGPPPESGPSFEDSETGELEETPETSTEPFQS